MHRIIEVAFSENADLDAAVAGFGGVIAAYATRQERPDFSFWPMLFDRLKLPAGKRTGKTRVASTAVDVLEDLALSHDLPRLILEWRSLQKLKGTYIDALPQLVNPTTGRVHTSFNQTGTATGRLSSTDPNLQNIPARSDDGRREDWSAVVAQGPVGYAKIQGP